MADATATVDKGQRLVDATLKRNQFRQDALIEVLHTAQSAYGFLAPEMLWYVARKLNLPPSKVYGVATFYNFFCLKPSGRHALVICQGTACYIRGAPKCAAAVRAAFGVADGQTTEDGALSVLTARCLGSCGMAPTGTLDGALLSQVTPEQLVARLRGTIAQDGAVAAAAPERVATA
jgi:bidirectional [NiFe] hydrogenase diaphorase subunit